MALSSVEMSAGKYGMEAGGEVHNSPAPLLTSLAITLCLGGLLVWPLAVLGVPLLVYSINKWLREEVGLWPERPVRNSADWGDASWAMVWIIITECIIFASFFAYWFWTRWHTISWDGSVGGTWPAAGVEHDITLVGINTVILLSSGILAHHSGNRHAEGDASGATKFLYGTILLGGAFLVIQLYEYTNAGFLWNDHPYGTAFFSLTGLHGLHVLVGLIALSVIGALMHGGHLPSERHDGYRAVMMYWHFVDAVWVLLFLIVYLEAI
ncbi:MAG: cytochrome c oxidase subunit 3 [Candidatus Thalassarchaeaceae archaeon]|jgi:heme/copper-type cytochrome/quinol oxidase subunit 3|nr:cytochrome c oxidase subunit 3 [Candidatus Thalassarchaeaceae archaeon]MDP7446054.1 cytochrome c oxidase subunit 3 [Candidatus Thalassarchaeaceae archaeon]